VGHGAWTLRTLAPLLLCGACRIGFDASTGPFDAAVSNADAIGDGTSLPALCPPSYTNTAGHLYRRETINNANWMAAQVACLADQVANSSRYTHLAVAGDAAEVGVIQNFTGNGNVWIGLSDFKVEGSFIWVTAEPTAGFPPATGSPWASGEPSGNASEDCAYESATGFADGLCTATFDYVCECDASPDDPSRY